RARMAGVAAVAAERTVSHMTVPDREQRRARRAEAPRHRQGGARRTRHPWKATQQVTPNKNASEAATSEALIFKAILAR
ncbi:hypothetical protein OFC18_33705, partial [Escherichia coli]|nr:hypothetical protein [Escherichia coli]